MFNRPDRPIFSRGSILLFLEKSPPRKGPVDFQYYFSKRKMNGPRYLFCVLQSLGEGNLAKNRKKRSTYRPQVLDLPAD